MENPLVSILIVNFNGDSDIIDCIDSIYKNTIKNFEIIVVDNNSTDDSIRNLEEKFSEVLVIKNKKNVGFAKGNNIGFKKLRGEYILLLNPDTILKEDSLIQLLDATYKGFNIVVPKIINFYTNRIDSEGAVYNNIGNYYGRNYNELDYLKTDGEIVPGITACCVLIKKSIVKSKLFSNHLFMYYEEFELTLNLRNNGHKIYYEPKSQVLHKVSKTVEKANPKSVVFKQIYGNSNRAYILFKYYPLKVILSNIHLIFLSFAYWSYYILRNGNNKDLLKFSFRILVQSLRGVFGRAFFRVKDKSWRDNIEYTSLSMLINYVAKNVK